MRTNPTSRVSGADPVGVGDAGDGEDVCSEEETSWYHTQFVHVCPVCLLGCFCGSFSPKERRDTQETLTWAPFFCPVIVVSPQPGYLNCRWLSSNLTQFAHRAGDRLILQQHNSAFPLLSHPLNSRWVRTDSYMRCTNFLPLWWFSFSPRLRRKESAAHTRLYAALWKSKLGTVTSEESLLFLRRCRKCFWEKVCCSGQQYELLRCLVASSCL